MMMKTVIHMIMVPILRQAQYYRDEDENDDNWWRK